MGLVSSTDMAATEIKYQCRWGVSRIQTGREYIHRVSEILLSARSQLFLCIYIGDPANIFSSASRVTACLVLRITSTMPRLREIHCSDSIDLYWPVIGQNADVRSTIFLFLTPEHEPLIFRRLTRTKD